VAVFGDVDPTTSRFDELDPVRWCAVDGSTEADVDLSRSNGDGSARELIEPYPDMGKFGLPVCVVAVLGEGGLAGMGVALDVEGEGG